MHLSPPKQADCRKAMQESSRYRPAFSVRPALCGLLVLPLLAVAPLSAQTGPSRAPQMSETSSLQSDPSQSPELKTPSIFHRPSKNSPAEQLVHAEAMERAKRTRRARRAYDALVHHWHSSAEAPQAQLGVARMREKAGSRMRAFQEYQYAIDNFSGLFSYEFAIGRQFVIANELRGELDRGFFGFGREAGVDDVVALFRRVARNAPSWERTPDCYLMMGLTYESDKRYDEAVVPYETLIARFPGHELAQTAAFRVAHCHYRLAQNSPRDERTLRIALSSQAAALRSFPDHPERDRLQAMLGDLRTRFVEMQYRQAAFYDRIRKTPGGAVLAYEEFIRTFRPWPEASTWVTAAQERVDALKLQLPNEPSDSLLNKDTP